MPARPSSSMVKSTGTRKVSAQRSPPRWSLRIRSSLPMLETVAPTCCGMESSGRVTTDHSLVERLVEAGKIDRSDVYDHPNRNLIYRSLGAGRSEVEVDIFTEKLQDGDLLLLCSDGLWEMVKDAQMESIITEVPDLVETCDLLIQRANENGGEDNITVVLLRCVEG